MLERLLLTQPAAAAALAVAALALDYYTTVYEAWLYQAGAKDFVVYEGLYRLNTDVEAIFVRRRLIPMRWAVTLLVLALGVAAVWWLLIRQSDRADVFLILMGGLILTPLSDALTQYRRIMFFREVRRRGGLSGRVIYTRRAALMQRVYEQYGFVLLYGLLFLLAGSWFFFGGAVACFVNSRRLRDWTIVKG